MRKRTGKPTQRTLIFQSKNIPNIFQTFYVTQLRNTFSKDPS